MKQRVAIARAILRAAPILLLDEATSALDSKNERIVQAALDDLVRKQVTGCVISIAHRLTTIRNCNKIVVIKDGYKLEEGARSLRSFLCRRWPALSPGRATTRHTRVAAEDSDPAKGRHGRRQE